MTDTLKASLAASTATMTLFFILLFAYTSLAGPLPLFINSVTTMKQHMFEVSGEGSSVAIPARAVFTAGITTEGTSVKDAQSRANAASARIIDSIKQLGIDSKYIRTISYNIYPNINNSNQINGYRVQQLLEITVIPLEKASEAIDAATTVGANTISALTFSLDDETRQKAETEARQKAVDAAKQKAQSLAEAAGIRLGRIIDISESYTGSPIPYLKAQAEGIRSGDNETVLPVGENEIRISVILSYETQ